MEAMSEKEKNALLNRLTDEIHRIVTQHDPENDVPIMHGVWNTLEKAFKAGADQ